MKRDIFCEQKTVFCENKSRCERKKLKSKNCINVNVNRKNNVINLDKIKPKFDHC